MPDSQSLPLSQDAAIVIALAETAMPFAVSPEDEAERWIRLLRLHGQVGGALQALGVGEAPLSTIAQSDAMRSEYARPSDHEPVAAVTQAARDFATGRGARCVATVDVLFAIFEVYGKAFDRTLYVRGTSREELVERLAVEAEVEGHTARGLT